MILCILLSLCLIFSLAACGSSAAGSSEQTAASATADTASSENEAAANEPLSGDFPGSPPDRNGGPGGTPPGGFGGGPGGNGGPGGGFGGGSSADIEYSGAAEVTSSDSQSGQSYASTTADESALLISTDADVTISDPTVTKSGDSDGGDNCNFYGLNAAVLVKGGTATTITGGTVSVTLDAASTWTLTGDTYITAFSGDASNVISNGYTLCVNGTALSGTRK